MVLLKFRYFSSPSNIFLRKNHILKISGLLQKLQIFLVCLILYIRLITDGGKPIACNRTITSRSKSRRSPSYCLLSGAVQLHKCMINVSKLVQSIVLLLRVATNGSYNSSGICNMLNYEYVLVLVEQRTCM